MLSLHSQTSRGGAVVARWAHNPKVTGSSPVPATSPIEVASKKMRPLLIMCLNKIKDRGDVEAGGCGGLPITCIIANFAMITRGNQYKE